MKIILYTITDCQFSKLEKEYLTAHKLAYEEKNLETNREFLTEMLTVSNNFAGTPVTKIEKDDGQIMVLKGFTPEEFNKALGYEVESTQTTPPAGQQPIQSVDKTQDKPITDSSNVAPPATSDTPPQTVPQVEEVPAAPLQAQPAEPIQPFDSAQGKPAPADLSADSSSVTQVKEEASSNPDPMANVLNNLAQQATAPATPAGMPNIPDPQL